MSANDIDRTQTPIEHPQNLPTKVNILNQKGFFPIIIGVIILLLVVAVGAYYLGMQRKNSATTEQTNSLPIQTDR